MRLSLPLGLLVTSVTATTGALVPGLYTISGYVSFWWFGGHLLILSAEENATASVLFAYDHDSDCIIPGCDWRTIYRAEVTSSTWEFSRAWKLGSSSLLLLLAAWHLGKHWQILCLILVAGALAAGNAASDAGSYEAFISVVKHNPEMQIPHVGEARAEIEVLESGRMRGRLRTWFTTHFLNVLLGGTVESAEPFDNQVPSFYKAMGHLYQDAFGQNFTLPEDALLGHAIPGNLEHMYSTFDGGCHPEEENGPKIAYSVESFMVPVVCLRYASGGLILKALQDNQLVSTIHVWQAASNCSTGPSGGTDAGDFPHTEYKLATNCNPWVSVSGCPEVLPVECFAFALSYWWPLVILPMLSW